MVSLLIMTLVLLIFNYSRHDFETFDIKLDKLLASKRSLVDDMLEPNVGITQELMQSIT